MTVQASDQMVTVTGSGVMDVDSQAAQFEMSAADGANTKELKMIYLGREAYEATPELPRVEPGKYWVSLDSADSENGTGQKPSALGIGGDPLALVSLLDLQSSTVEGIGTADTGRGKVSGYLLTVSPDEIRSLASRGELPGPLDLLASAPLSALSAEVYIDGNGRLTEDSLTVGISTPDPVTITNHLDFSSYGVAITVKAPPASTVITYRKLMQDLGNRQGLVI